MRRVIYFYKNQQPANQKIFYLYEDIINLWPDYRLQVKNNYINWLFPSETDKDTKLNSTLINSFRINRDLRKQVVKAVLRMMNFFGFTIVYENGEYTIKQIKPVNRQENSVTVGLYNTENYQKITRILHFLHIIRMDRLSILFFLMLCQAIKSNPDLQHLVKTKANIREWITTQPYLEGKKFLAEEALIGEELAEWERDNIYVETAKPKMVGDAWDEE